MQAQVLPCCRFPGGLMEGRTGASLSCRKLSPRSSLSSWPRKLPLGTPPHFGETLQGSFSAVSTPIFVTKYCCYLILQHLSRSIRFAFVCTFFVQCTPPKSVLDFVKFFVKRLQFFVANPAIYAEVESNSIFSADVDENFAIFLEIW